MFITNISIARTKICQEKITIKMTFKSYKGLLARRAFIFKEDESQVYGRVTQVLGGGRFKVTCFDGLDRVCLVRGQFRHKHLLQNNTLRNYYWIQKRDLVLVSLRSFQQDKGDIIFKYTKGEEIILEAKGHIVEHKEEEEEAVVFTELVITFSDD